MSGKLRFYRKYLYLAGLAALVIAGAVFAYSPHYTHPDLTEEMVKFYNTSGQQKIGSESLSALRQGSIDEDTDPRWINHFYDPQSGEGWTGEHLGPHSKETVQRVSNTLVAMNFTPLPAPKWAEDQGAQNKFISYGWNHTWQKAIYDYANGDKKTAFESLGYILHLIEDMSVPDHTRNDSHPHVAGDPGSPYEEWAKAYTNGHKLDTAEKLLKEGGAIPQFSSLKEAFDYTAKYSNENFFSEETINDKKYVSPRATDFETKGEVTYAYGVLEGGRRVVLYKFSNQDITTATLSDELILSQYFSRLSRRSVLAGAGVIELFFKEAERAKNDQSVLEKPPAPPTAMGTLGAFMLTRVVSPLGLGSSLARGIANLNLDVGRPSELGNLQNDSIKAMGEEEKSQLKTYLKYAVIIGGILAAPFFFSDELRQNVRNNLANVSVATLPEENKPADSAPKTAENAPPPPAVQAPIKKAAKKAVSPASPPASLNKSKSQSGQPSTGLVAKVSTTTSAATTSDIASQSALLQLQPIPASGVGGGGGGSQSVTPTSDTTPPDISFSITECGNSLSSDGCLVAGSSLSLAWSSSAGDLDHYILECTLGGVACSGFNFSNTTATSVTYSLPSNDSIYTFKAKAQDHTGNISSATIKTVEYSSRPVVINEIAWAGSSASAADEWIEFYNRASKTVNLSGWVLRAEDGAPYINLSGTISAGGYYLIERTSNNAVSDVAADLVASFTGVGSDSGLGDSGETLVLSRASTTIDQNVLCSNAWCGGSTAGNKLTSERIDPDVAGTDSINWGTSNGLVKNGKDSAGANLTATPRARNSLHYLISQGSTLSVNRTLKKSFGTYIIKPNDNFTVSAGKTLTIEPGVTVKIGSESKLLVDGTLKSDGAAADRITFTTLDGSAWMTVKITSSSVNSSISYTNFTGGGKFFNNTFSEERAMLSVVSVSPSVSNSIFENSLSAGARFTSSNSSISGNTFSVGTTAVDMAGLYLFSGSPTVSGNTFSSNYIGIKAEGASASFSSNTFTNNISYALYSLNEAATFSGNSGSGNGKNGILLVGAISQAGGTTTFSANSLPYLIGEDQPKIAAGSGAIIEAGTTWKGETPSSKFEISGTLNLTGASKDSIIFTSLADTGPAEWYGIVVNAGGYLYGGGFTLRYAGKGTGCPTCAGIFLNGGLASLSNGRIQNNYLAGMRIYSNATTTLSNFEFLDHATPAGNVTALIAADAGIILENTTFSGNALATSSSNSTIEVR